MHSRQLNLIMKIILPFLLLTFSLSGVAQDCSIIQNLDEFIVLHKNEYEGRVYLYETIEEIDDDVCFSGIINESPLFMDYLLTNFASHANYSEWKAIEDSAQRSQRYYTDLANDSLFVATLDGLVQKSIEGSVPKDTITTDELLNIAVKFFSIPNITEEGHYTAKVCVGTNGIRSTEEVRRPYLEAFCFSSIFENLSSEEYPIYDEFVNTVRDLYALNLGVSEEERLLRAQGAIFITMKNSEVLLQLLLHEYENKKHFLPFALEVRN